MDGLGSGNDALLSAMKANAEKLMTHYDIYATLRDILHVSTLVSTETYK